MIVRTGQMLSHYRLIKKIGEGGMGVVFLAEDTSLRREVALKVLPEDMASDREHLKRFQREAEALAALNHPHIVTIHSVEETEGVRFLTMELVEGETLDRLVSSGGVPLPRLFDVGVALSDALAAAHDRGVVHRDLKPSNVMVMKDGRVKVLDFGLAKLARESTRLSEEGRTQTTALTGEGNMMGTLPYMSPEQLQQVPVDHRTDIFSLGIILYELAVGHRPFTGPNAAAVTSSILRDTPVAVTTLRSGLPHHLGRIIAHCLDKDPEQRTQSARDVRNELRELRKEAEPQGSPQALAREFGPSAHAAPASPGLKARTHPPIGVWIVGITVIVGVAVLWWLGLAPRGSGLHLLPSRRGTPASVAQADIASIAVLPFVNMSSDRDNEYFSDGLAEELLNALAKTRGLRVVGRTSSFEFKGKNEDLRIIGQKLHVGAILEGSVRKAGNRVRITVQLINAADGYHRWSQTYDRELKDIFAVQEEIASVVTSELNRTLLGNVPEKVESRPNEKPTTVEAYSAYLQARFHQERGTEEDLKKAVEQYQRAIQLDRNYAPAYTGLAGVYEDQADLGQVPANEGYRKTRQALERALTLDEGSADAHSVLGWMKMVHEWDFAGAERELQRAVGLTPGNAAILRHAALLAMIRGRTDECLALERRAVELEPLSAPTYYNLGWHAFYAGRLDEAAAAIGRALELSPDFPAAHKSLGLVYLAKGRTAAALGEMHHETDVAFRLQGFAIANHALKRKKESDDALAKLIGKFRRDSAFQIAEVFAFRGENESAFKWFDRAYAQHDPGMLELNADPLTRSLWKDPRYVVLLKKMRLG